MKQCPNCGAQVTDDSRFCTECGKEFPQGNICPHCGASVNEGDAFCQNCGKNLNAPVDEDSVQYEEEKDEKSWLRNYLPYIVGVILLVGIVGFFFSKKFMTNTDSFVDKDSLAVDEMILEDSTINTEEEIPEPFTTTTVSFKKTAPGEPFEVEAEIVIDYPNSGPESLKNEILSFIMDALNNTYTWEEVSKNPHYNGDLTDGQKVVDFYGNAKIKELQEEGIGTENISIRKCFETDSFISYEVDFGGSHGGVGDGTKYGVSFSKSSGKRIKVIDNPNSNELKSTILTFLDDIEYGIDYELFENHPFPKKEPFLVRDGVRFIYQKYEIAGGASGEIEFTIPYNRAKGYMTSEALLLSGYEKTSKPYDNERSDSNNALSKYVGRWSYYITSQGKRAKVYTAEIYSDNTADWILYMPDGSVNTSMHFRKCVYQNGYLYLTDNGDISIKGTPRFRLGSNGLQTAEGQDMVKD